MSKDTTKDTDNPNFNSSNEANTGSKSQDSVTFALAQSHFLVGDITANAEKMRALALQAREQGADVIIFPELALLGYPPQDLLLRPSLSGRVKSALSSLSDIDDIVMIVEIGRASCRERVEIAELARARSKRREAR